MDNLEKEIWRGVIYIKKNGEIENFAKEYVVNQFGQIKSIKNNLILKPFERNKGSNRWCVNLCKCGIYEPRFVHRIVLSSFQPQSDTYENINHKDENPSNNFLSNLEWCTQKYNNNYGTRNERIQRKHSNAILQIDLDDNVVKEWFSATQAQKESNNYYTQTCISACCRGERKTHKGFKWKYK